MTFSIAVWMLVARIQKVVWPPGNGRHPWAWLGAAVMFGPVLGVSCFQWALSLQNSVLVLSVTASAPVLIMPLAAWLDGDRPARLAIVGAVIAVAGVILLLRLTPA
jgi:drug/metabolite transporter (DMT)-like permease